jgi:hypothetical protein
MGIFPQRFADQLSNLRLNVGESMFPCLGAGAVVVKNQDRTACSAPQVT